MIALLNWIVDHPGESLAILCGAIVLVQEAVVPIIRAVRRG